MRHRRGGKDRLGQLVILQAPSEMALWVAEGLILIDRIGVERHRFHLEWQKSGVGFYARQRSGFVDVAKQVVHPFGVVVNVVPTAPAARHEEIDAVEDSHAGRKGSQRVVSEIEIALVVPRIERF